LGSEILDIVFIRLGGGTGAENHYSKVVRTVSAAADTAMILLEAGILIVLLVDVRLTHPKKRAR